MMEKPGISCVCVTHGRPWLLEEAIESFNMQYYAGDAELLIVNDCPEQKLRMAEDVDDITIMNLSEPITNLSTKFNIAVQAASYNLIAWWEDDDISLPHRLISSEAKIGDKAGYKQGRSWFWHKCLLGPSLNLFFGSSLFRKDAYLEAGGADELVPPDVSAWNNLTNHERGTISEESDDLAELYWIYRWGGSAQHDSGYTGTLEQKHKQFRLATLSNPLFRSGVIELRPAWRKDYKALAEKWVETHKDWRDA